jgi:enterochelin esterase-like enzyme/sugar lactone lactonase YvrE
MNALACRKSKLAWLAVLFGAYFAFSGARLAAAEDWGRYAIIPASAPAFVLEAVGSGKSEGTIVSIGRPAGAPSQKWIITPKSNDLYTIRPAHTDRVLAVAGGKTQHGALIVLETDRGAPSQEWRLLKNDDGTYCILPAHAPGKGMDHFGGDPTPGARIDLWGNQAGDRHLQWIIKPLAGTLPAGASGAESAVSTYIAPEIEPAAIKKGRVETFTFKDSKVFPGTVRDVAVFIPAQYDGSRPACVYVKTDGYNPVEKTLLERLIATKEMPVTVGVFVRPGDLPPTVPHTMGRRNRCFEYDGVGDANVRFLIDELLPFVARAYDVKLSESGNDRCIAGGSSGGIAAFNAAWERPDAFTRVYANSGSFVAFRGGHEFPTLVRKVEAKPIRSFLTTGTRDMENCAGDWFLIDLEMDKALKFAGYDYTFRTLNGGHVAGYYENFPEAMSFIWKGWPEPVKAGPSAPRVRDVIVPGESWSKVVDGRKGAVSAACGDGGQVYFVETGNNTISRIDVDGKIAPFITDAAQANGLSVGADGRLYTVSESTGKVLSYDAAGNPNVVAEKLSGRHVLAMPKGGLYVTGDGGDRRDHGTIWFVKDGKATTVESGPKRATGLAYRPDQWLLSVADGASKWVYSYQINSDGTLTNRERFFWLHVEDWEDDAGAEAVCFAKEGQMLVATRWGVQICADDGPTQVILPMPDRSRVFGLCFGGRDMDMLYAFCGSTIWKRKVKIHGVGAFTPWLPGRGSPL